jgi:hypothetical protein
MIIIVILVSVNILPYCVIRKRCHGFIKVGHTKLIDYSHNVVLIHIPRVTAFFLASLVIILVEAEAKRTLKALRS